MGAWAFCCLTAAVTTKTLTLQAGFAAFTNPVIWLIVCSFFFACGFQKTGLGQRVANLFVKFFGKSTLGLAYGLCCADALGEVPINRHPVAGPRSQTRSNANEAPALVRHSTSDRPCRSVPPVSPAMPSTSARAGGIFMPIVLSLSEARIAHAPRATPSTVPCRRPTFVPHAATPQASGSKPNDPSRKRMGAFLTNALLHSSNHSSNLFLTAAAQNLLCLNLAAGLGVAIKGPWATWFVAACVPALVGIAFMPYLCYLLSPPELKDTPEAPAMVRPHPLPASRCLSLCG